MKEQYRVELPTSVSEQKLRKWCKKNLNGRVKLTYKKKYDEKRKKWVRDYNTARFRFQDEDDAMAFRLRWE